MSERAPTGDAGERMAAMLGLELYVVLTTADTDLEALAELLPEHMDHQVRLERAGHLFMAGPWIDPHDHGRITGGLTILRATSLEHATELVANDPFVTAGLFTFEVRRWRLNEGHMELAFDLSDQTVKFR